MCNPNKYNNNDPISSVLCIRYVDVELARFESFLFK